MEKFEEKRRHRRVSGVFEVIADFRPEIPVKFSCSSYDISEGGMRIATQKEPLVGINVKLKFKLPDNPKELTPRGVVVWSSALPQGKAAFQAGIKFTEINDIDKEAIRSYVSTR